MARVLVVYCSLTGNTEVAAQAVADGATSPGAEVVLKAASHAEPEDLQACDGVALGSYDAFTYMDMGGAIKDFLDRSLRGVGLDVWRRGGSGRMDLSAARKTTVKHGGGYGPRVGGEPPSFVNPGARRGRPRPHLPKAKR